MNYYHVICRDEFFKNDPHLYEVPIMRWAKDEDEAREMTEKEIAGSGLRIKEVVFIKTYINPFVRFFNWLKSLQWK